MVSRQRATGGYYKGHTYFLILFVDPTRIILSSVL
jgi:hypothetical protein